MLSKFYCDKIRNKYIQFMGLYQLLTIVKQMSHIVKATVEYVSHSVFLVLNYF